MGRKLDIFSFGIFLLFFTIKSKHEIILHGVNVVSTRRQNDVLTTLFSRLDVVLTLSVGWEAIIMVGLKKKRLTKCPFF